MKFYKDNYIDEPPDFLQELKDCAWNVVMENPGIDMAEWAQILIRQFPTEVVDAYGTNYYEVMHCLADLWETEYTNPDNGDWNSFAGWSEYFATDSDVLQERLEQANERIKELEAEIALLKARLDANI